MKRVVIGGGGIAGLATALKLRDLAPEGTEIVVLESGDRLGGNIRTERADGFIVEWGPNGYLDNVPTTPALIDRIGLADEVQPADARAAKRFLYRGGKLHELAASPLRFFGSPVLSWPGKLRILGEPFAQPKPNGVDETVGEFATRRIGAEAAHVLVDAMVSGVFAGNVDKLSVESAFPKMAKMEAEHGSLFKAMMAAGKARKKARREAERLAGASGGGVGSDGGRGAAERAAAERNKGGGGPAGPGGTLTSFRNGLDTFILRLGEELGTSIQLRSPIQSIAWSDAARTWTVQVGTNGNRRELEADVLVLTMPAVHASPLLAPLQDDLSRDLSQIPTAPLAVVALAYDAAEIGGDPDGFGFLVPRGQGPRILGCLWDSSLFPGRAPKGKVLLRAMIGGAHDPCAVDLSDDGLLREVRRDLEVAMGLRAEPIRTWVFRHRLGIAQYDVGHSARLGRIHEALGAFPGLWLAGSSYYGVAMNACIENAGKQAEAIVQYLRQPSNATRSVEV
ncbi:MAG: protoporphyrinogen oxidase [Candidatus Eisenbacteria bacterium]